VIEADESDGSVVRYRPWAGVVLNLARDHKEMEEVAAMFSTFRGNCPGPFIVGEGANLDFLRPGAVTFGLGDRADIRGRDLVLGPRAVAFSVDGVRFQVPWPGRHTVLNALAAMAACRQAGVPLADMAAPLAAFQGVERRFVSLGTAGGVEVIDDFAHNPDKLSAAIRTAHQRLEGGTDWRPSTAGGGHRPGPGDLSAPRLRPHALPAPGPRGRLADALRPQDVIWLPEIFYGGGTVTKDISSADLVADLRARGCDARFAAVRTDLPALVAAEARPGDLVLVMGARDPSLTDLGQAILLALGAAGET
jgi:UDP-N-acetylmuramate-alanine ligase